MPSSEAARERRAETDAAWRASPRGRAWLATYHRTRVRTPRKPPIGRRRVLDEDLAQERALAELERARGGRRVDVDERVERYRRRETKWHAVTVPIVTYRETYDGEGVEL